MRRTWWPVLVGALSVAIAGLGLPTAAGATVQQDGLRILAASATLADPAACAGSECDATYLTVASGVLGADSSKVRIDQVVLVDVFPSVVTDEGLFPTGPATVSGCTTDADVVLGRNLGSAQVATRGEVALNEFVQHDDGSIECSQPTGHRLDLRASFTGIGVVSTYGSQSQQSTPFAHEVTGDVQKARLATAEVTGRLDGVTLGEPWPGSEMLMSTASRSLVLTHRVAVGSAVRGPLHAAEGADITKIASGYAGGWSIDATVNLGPGGSEKTTLGVSGMVGDDFCWGDGEPSQIALSDDVTSGTVTGSVVLYCGEAAVEYGTVDVSATWTGVGDAWRFGRTGVSRSPDGHSSYRVTGIHRDASLTLVLDGAEITGGAGYLEVMAFTSTPKTG